MRPNRRAFLAFVGAGAAGLGAGKVEAAAGRNRPLPLLSTYIAGSDRYDAPAVVDWLKEGSVLRLRREPDNGYDMRAVAVWTADGQQKLGYVPRIHNQALANVMDAGLIPEAQVDDIKGSPARPDITVSVTVIMRY